MTRKFFQIAVSTALVFGLMACQPQDDLDIDGQLPADGQGTAAQTQTQTQAQAGAQTGVVGGNNVSGSETMQQGGGQDGGFDDGLDPYGAPDKKVFYFEFDRSSLNVDDLDVIAEHGQYLASSPTAQVRLEGHTDERGTREYNIALGEDRAKAVERILQLQGVRTEQISILSLGEEDPAEIGHDENSWSMNRRVQLIYIAH